MNRVAVALVALAVLAGCGSPIPDAANRQASVRRECEGLVRNQLGRVDFRHNTTTQDAQASGATAYVASGKADAALGSYTFRCEATITPDLTLTARLVKLER